MGIEETCQHNKNYSWQTYSQYITQQWKVESFSAKSEIRQYAQSQDFFQYSIISPRHSKQTKKEVKVMYPYWKIQFKLLSHVWFFATQWTAACQASRSITTSQSLLKLIFIELVILYNHFILCHPLFLLPSIFPSIKVFLRSQFFTSGRHSIWASALASVLPMTIQDWFLFQFTGLISLQSKGLSRVFSNTTVQKHQFFSAQLSLWSNSHIYTWLLEKP